MKIKLLIVNLFIVFFSVTGFSQDWLTDYETALSTARVENKPVLVFFTGSDWCPPCKMTVNNVYSKQEFIDFADQNLILVVADFPKRSENQLSAEQKQKNNMLATNFGVRGFPTSIILDKNGKELGRWVGYDPAGVSGYIQKFSEAAQL
jgi:thioredoxin-related protein